MAVENVVDFLFRFVLSTPFGAQVDQMAFQGGPEAKKSRKNLAV